MGVSRDESFSKYGTEVRRINRQLWGECCICHKFVKRTNKWGSRRKTCGSKECKLEMNKISHPKRKSICKICGIQIMSDKSGKMPKTCSLECSGKLISLTNKRKGIIPPSQLGKKWGIDYPIENHNWWKGGITPLRSQIWKTKSMRDWRDKVFARDNYTCRVCDKKGGKLHPHHSLITFSEILEKYQIKSLEEAKMCSELWDIQNGKTLCVTCHRLTPTWGVNNRPRKENVCQVLIG